MTFNSRPFILYSDKTITSDKLFDLYVKEIIAKKNLLGKLEQRLYVGEPGRLTLGFLGKGIKLNHLNEGESFALHSIKEGIQGAILSDDPKANSKLQYLAKIFPQFLPKKDTHESPQASFDVHRVRLEHSGCCGNEHIIPDNINP